MVRQYHPPQKDHSSGTSIQENAASRGAQLPAVIPVQKKDEEGEELSQDQSAIQRSEQQQVSFPGRFIPPAPALQEAAKPLPGRFVAPLQRKHAIPPNTALHTAASAPVNVRQLVSVTTTGPVVITIDTDEDFGKTKRKITGLFQQNYTALKKLAADLSGYLDGASLKAYIRIKAVVNYINDIVKFGSIPRNELATYWRKVLTNELWPELEDLQQIQPLFLGNFLLEDDKEDAKIDLFRSHLRELDKVLAEKSVYISGNERYLNNTFYKIYDKITSGESSGQPLETLVEQVLQVHVYPLHEGPETEIADPATAKWLRLKQYTSRPVFLLLSYMIEGFDKAPPENAQINVFLEGLQKKIVALAGGAGLNEFHLLVRLLEKLYSVSKFKREDEKGTVWAKGCLLGILPALNGFVAKQEVIADREFLRKITNAYEPFQRETPQVKQLLQKLAPFTLDNSLAHADEYETWELAKIVGAFSSLVRESKDIDKKLEQLAPILEARLRSGAPGSLLDYNLADIAHTYAYIKYKGEAIYNLFRAMLPHLEKTKLSPRSLSTITRSFANAFGGTDFMNLPEDIKKVLSGLSATSSKMLPENLKSADGEKQMGSRDITRSFSGFIQFRHLPDEIMGTLHQMVPLMIKAVQSGETTATDLRNLLQGYVSLQGNLGSLSQVYEVIVKSLEIAAAKGNKAPVQLIQLAVTAYNHRDILAEQAIWYGNEADYIKGTDRQKEAALKATAKALKEKSPKIAAALSEALLLMVTQVHKHKELYTEEDLRLILFEFTKITGLKVKQQEGPRDAEDLDEQEENVTEQDKLSASTFGIFHTLSAEKFKDYHTYDHLKLVFLIYNYGWLKERTESDRTLLTALIKELSSRFAIFTANDFAAAAMELSRLRRPTSEITVLKEDIAIAVSHRLASHYAEFTPHILSNIVSAYKQFGTPNKVIQQFIELLEAVVAHKLDKADDVTFASLVKLTSGYINFEDADRQTSAGPLKHKIIRTLRGKIATAYPDKAGKDPLYHREKARTVRHLLPLKNYDASLNEYYPKEAYENERIREQSKRNFHHELRPLKRDTSTSYQVHTITSEGELIKTEVWDNVIFRELTGRHYDFVIVELPSTPKREQFKSVIPFRGKDYRIDVYGGSKLKKESDSTTIHTIGVEAGAIDFFKDFFNYKEAFYYMQRALIPNDKAPTVGLKGSIRGKLYPDDPKKGEEIFKLKDLPFRAYDGMGYIKKNTALKMGFLEKNKKGISEKPANLSYQALHWYPEEEAMIKEGIDSGVQLLINRQQELEQEKTKTEKRMQKKKQHRRQRHQQQAARPQPAEPDENAKKEKEKGVSNDIFRSLSTGKPKLINSVAVPVVKGGCFVFPANTEALKGIEEGAVVGRTPFDNPNLQHVPPDKIAYYNKNIKATEQLKPEDRQASEFLSQMEVLQYTLTGYIQSADEFYKGEMAFFKGLLGVVDDEHWPAGFDDVDLVVSGEDIKMDVNWKGQGKKVKPEGITAFTIDGMLIAKEWYKPEFLVGVPVDKQKWLAGDYDGDQDAILFKKDNPALYGLIEKYYETLAVSNKIQKSVTDTGEEYSRIGQIFDILSPVLGTWSTISDRIRAAHPEDRQLLADALIQGNRLEMDTEKITGLVLKHPEKKDMLVHALNRLNIFDSDEAIDAYAGENKEMAGKIKGLNPTERAALTEKLDAENSFDSEEEIKAWCEKASPRQRQVLIYVFRLELTDLEIQMGIKVGTDGFKTMAESAKYYQRAKEYLQTMNKLGIAKEAVPYGKGLLKKLPEIGFPDLRKKEWQTLYFRAKALYGNPARVMEGVVFEYSLQKIVLDKYKAPRPQDIEQERQALDAKVQEGYENWKAEHARKEKEEPQESPDQQGKKLDELINIFKEQIYPAIGHEPEKEPKPGEPEQPFKPPVVKPPVVTSSISGTASVIPPKVYLPIPIGRLQHAPNSCYIASLIALFARTPEYGQLFRQGDHPLRLEKGGNIEDRRAELVKGQDLQKSDMRQIITALQQGDTDIQSGSVFAFMQLLNKLGMLLPGTLRAAPLGAQQDAAEILQKMLTVLQPGPGLLIREQSQLSPAGQQKFTDSVGQPVNALQLPISDRGIGSIPDALKAYCKTEKNIDYENALVDKRLRFSAMPKVLTIVLKRFEGGAMRSAKISKQVIAPDVLVIPPECLHSSIAHLPFSYQLESFVHQAGLLHTGHYTTFGKDDQGEWYKHDDVGGLSRPGAAVGTDKNTAYIYVYRLLSALPVVATPTQPVVPSVRGAKKKNKHKKKTQQQPTAVIPEKPQLPGFSREETRGAIKSIQDPTALSAIINDQLAAAIISNECSVGDAASMISEIIIKIYNLGIIRNMKNKAVGIIAAEKVLSKPLSEFMKKDDKRMKEVLGIAFEKVMEHYQSHLLNTKILLSLVTLDKASGVNSLSIT